MLPEHACPTESVSWDSVSERGPRETNADACAVHRDPATGRLAFAVADGIGDHPRAAWAAELSAHTAAVAATVCDPGAAVLAAQRAVLAQAPDERDGDTVLAVATVRSGPAGDSWDIAWVGDCRAYYWNGRVLAQVTVDHTVAEYCRARRQPVTPRMEHLVTTSVRTARADLVGRGRTGPGLGRLLLCSDGLHRELDVTRIRAILDQPATPGTIAATLVGAAHWLGGRDNATALVVDASADRPAGAVAA